MPNSNNGNNSINSNLNNVNVSMGAINVGTISSVPSNIYVGTTTTANTWAKSIQEQLEDGFNTLKTDNIKHEGENLDLYLKAIVILLNQKGISISENEIREVVNSIKVMDKLIE